MNVKMAVCALAMGLALVGTAQAEPLAPAAKPGAAVKTMGTSAIVKLGRAVQEEYFQTPPGPVLRELVPGGARAAHAAGKTPVKSANAKA